LWIIGEKLKKTLPRIATDEINIVCNFTIIIKT